MFPIEDADEDQIEMGAAHITNEVIGLLHTALANSGISQRELAARLGVGESRVSQVLNGDGNLRLTTIGRFLAAMNCKVDLSPRAFDAPSPRRRSRAKSAEESVSVWHHSVTSKAGCYNAFVVASGVEGPADVIHHTGRLIFDSSSLPLHTWQSSDALGHFAVSKFRTPWRIALTQIDQEPSLQREATNA